MPEAFVLCLAAFLAGALNAVAGGGTFLTFPALVYAGLPAVAADATSAVAVFPGYLSGALGFRRGGRPEPGGPPLLCGTDGKPIARPCHGRMPARRALANAELVHLDGAISPGRFHQGPPLISFPVCCHRALSVAPPRFWTVSQPSGSTATAAMTAPRPHGTILPRRVSKRARAASRRKAAP